MAILLQDGTPLLLQDGSDLLLQGETAGGTLPAAAAVAAAAVPFVLPPSTGTGEVTASAGVLVPAALLPAAPGVTAAAKPLETALPGAGVSAAGVPLHPAGIIPPAAVTAAGRSFDQLLPVAPSVAAAAAAPHVPGRLPAAGVRVHAQPLQPPAGSALDTGYPSADLGAMVELNLGGTWTDVTAAALPDGQNYGQIKSGQPDGAQQPAPASMKGTWDNPDYTFSARNTASPYFGQLKQNTPARVSFASPYGTYLRLENDSDDRAFASDTAALRVTGSMEVRVAGLLSDYRTSVLAARWDGTQGSWMLRLNDNGALSFSWFDSGGTDHSVQSPSAVAVSWRAFRVTLDASNGNVQFFAGYDIDGPWTSLGAAASGTGGAATSVQAGNAPLVVGWTNGGGLQLHGQVYGFRLYNGIGGTVVADPQFGAQVPGATSWTDHTGLAWNLAGGAEITNRDYRLYGELASLAPTADSSGGMPRLTATLAGRMRRLQQGYAPNLESPMRRAVLTQAGSLLPVAYWPMEDGIVAKSFGPAIGTHLLTMSLGKVKPAADTSFEAAAPLPTLNGDSLSFTVDSYTGASAWAVRFLYKQGSTLPASGTSARVIEINTTGACTKLQVFVNSDGTMNLKGFLSSGAAAWTESAEIVFPQSGSPAWWSVEATTSGSSVNYALVALAPGATEGNADSHLVSGHGSFGNVTGGTVNTDQTLTDTVFGHLSVQKAWASLFNLGDPLNAWRGELADVRFARICAEQGITSRIIGRSAVTQAMGPQPRGSAWTVLKDCAFTEQGLLFEPRDCFGLGFRTWESLGIQAPAVTLDFGASNLRGDLQPVDDDSQLLNDITLAMPDGTQYRVVLDDGSPRSVSEPPTGAGRYAGQPPASFNLADASQFATVSARYLARSTVDEQRYRNITADFGIDGAPVADIARVRPGDLIAIVNVPALYQSTDIGAIATGATETFGPGRVIAWDTVPSAPYGS